MPTKIKAKFVSWRWLILFQTRVGDETTIQTKVIDAVKERIFNIDKSIREVAYELGFKRPKRLMNTGI